MRISLKVLAFLWIVLLLMIGGLLFNAYSKLKPETFIALLTEQVQKNYPGSKLNVGKVSYRFSLDFNLNLQNIHLRRSDKLLASIGEVELKVPWWLLLANHGNAQINLKDLDIYVDHDSIENSGPALGLDLPVSDKIKVALPDYLAEANFTFRAKQISIRDIHTARRYFVVSKLLVREFQYGKNSAFELNIPITIRHKDSQFSSDLWLFGDVTPETNEWSMNYRGEFRTRESNDKFQIEDLVIGGAAKFVPTTFQVSSDLTLQIDKQTIGTGVFSADQELLNLNLNLTQLPLNYFTFIYEEIKNPYLVNPEGEAIGNLKFQRSFDSAVATFSGKLNFNGNLYLTDKDNIPGKWQIGFQDSRWEVSFMSPKGEASFFRRSVVDLKTNTVTQYIEELGFSGLDLGLTIAPVAPLHRFMTETSGTYYTTTISYKKCLLNDQILDGQFKYGHTPEQKFYQGEITNDTTSFKANYTHKTETNSLDLHFKSFRWDPSYQFLAPYFSSLKGNIDGKVEGRWTNSWETGLWLTQLNGSDLQEPQGKVSEFFNRTFSFFEVETKAFPKLGLNLSGKNGVITLNSLMLENSESVKITGSLSSKQKSFLTLSYPKNKKLKAVKKEVLEPYWMQKEEP
jgi:hypothetical protein